MTRKDFIAQFCIQNYAPMVRRGGCTRVELAKTAIIMANTLEAEVAGFFFDPLGYARLCDQLDLINQKGINVNINEPCEK